MIVLDLIAIANQEFTTYQDGNQYDITVQEINGAMSATVTMNGILVCSGQRCIAGTPLLPFKYIPNLSGNFCFLCLSDDTIYYTYFGSLQLLVYLSYAEMQALGATYTITQPSPYPALFNNDGVLSIAYISPYPLSAAGLAPGAIWSNGGAVSVVPGVTPNPSAKLVYFNSITSASLLAMGGGNLPLTSGPVGSLQLWNNSGEVSVS